MRYRFSIPLVFVISGVSGWLSWVLDFNVMAVVVVASAVLLAFDSRLIGAHRYRATMGQPPSAVAIVTVLVWPVAFPMYLALRRRISRGEAALRTEGDGRVSVGWSIAIGVLGLGVLGGAVWLRSMLGNVSSLQAIAEQVAMTNVGVNVAPGHVTVSVPAGIATDTVTQRQVAEDIGRNLVWESDLGALLGDITVEYVTLEEHGTVVRSQVVAQYAWASADLNDEERTRTKGRFTLDFTDFPSLSGDCLAEGSYNLWSSGTETIGHASGEVACGDADGDRPLARAYLRLGQAPGEQVGLMEIGLRALQEDAVPCGSFNQCVCPIILESTQFAVTLSCDLGDARGFIALKFRRDEKGEL